MSEEYRKITDEEIALALRDEGFVLVEKSPLAFRVSDLAAEIVRSRRQIRHDSRRSQQIKRVRWLVEALLTKVEDLEEANDEEAVIIEQIAKWIEQHPTVDPSHAAAAIRDGAWR